MAGMDLGALGEAFVAIRGDASQLPADFKAAEQQVARHLADISAHTKQMATAMETNLSAAGKAVRKTGDDVGVLSGILRTATGVATGFIAGFLSINTISAVFGKVKDAAIGMNATLETTTLKFTTLMGDATGAGEHVRDLFEFAKKTPFETGPIIEASLKLRTFGGAALDTKENLKLLGDASAATGAPIQELGFWVGRMYSQIQGGKPFGEAAMRLQELAVMTPKARDEMERLQKSGASADQVFEAFKDSLGGFTGAMEAQAGTWEGVVSTLSDTVNMLIADTLKPYFEVLRDFGAEVNKALEASGDALDGLSKRVGETKDRFIDIIDIGLGGFIKALAFVMVEVNAAKVIFGDLMQVIDLVRLAWLYLRAAFAAGLMGPADLKALQETAARIRELKAAIEERGKSLQADKAAEQEWIKWADQAAKATDAMVDRLKKASAAQRQHAADAEQSAARQKAAMDAVKAAPISAGPGGASALAKTVTDLAASGDLSNKVMAEVVAAVGRAKVAYADLPPVLQNIVRAYTEVKGAQTEQVDKFQQLRDQIAAAKKILAEFTEAQKADIQAGLKAGMTAAEVAKSLSLNAMAVEMYAKSLTGAGKASKDAAKEQDAYTAAAFRALSPFEAYGRVLAEIGNDTYEGIAFDHQRGLTVAELAKSYKLTQGQIEQVIDVEKRWNAELDETMKRVKAFEKDGVEGAAAVAKGFAGMPAVLRTVGQTLGSIALDARNVSADGRLIGDVFTDADEKIRAAMTASARSFLPLNQKQRDTIKLMHDVGISADEIARTLGISLKQVNEEIGSVGLGLDGLVTLLGGFASILTEIAQVSGDSFGGMIRDIAEIVTAWNLAAKAAQNFRDAEGKAGKAIALAQGVSAVISATGSGSTGKRVAGGAITGAQLGATIGSVIPGLGTVIGAGIGALVGGAIGLIRAKMKGEWGALTADVGRDMGVHISEALAKKLEDTSKAIGRQATMTLNLGAIIDDVGGIDAFGGVDKAIAKTRDLFVLFAGGKITAQQTGQALDNVFGKLLPDAVSKGTGIAKKSLVELVKLAEQFKIPSIEIDAFVKTNVGEAFKGLDAAFGPVAAAIEKQKKLQEDLKTASGETRVQIEKDLKAQADLLDVIGLHSQAAATASAGAILAGIAAMREHGVSFRDAFEQALPAIEHLQEALKAAGLDGGQAFQELVDMAALAKDEIAGPALDAIAGLGDALVGLANTGRLTEDMFTGLAGQIAATVAALVSQGKDQGEILKMIQPELQKIWELQQRFGFAVDEATQALLDEALAAGKIGEQFKSPQEQMVDGIHEMVDMIRALGEGLGITMPEAAQRGADKIKKSMDDVTKTTEEQSRKLFGQTLPDAAAAGAAKVGEHLQVIARDGMTAGKEVLKTLGDALQYGLPQAAADGGAVIGGIMGEIAAAGDAAADDLAKGLGKVFEEGLPEFWDSGADDIQHLFGKVATAGDDTADDLKKGLGKELRSGLSDDAKFGVSGVVDALATIPTDIGVMVHVNSSGSGGVFVPTPSSGFVFGGPVQFAPVPSPLMAEHFDVGGVSKGTYGADRFWARVRRGEMLLTPSDQSEVQVALQNRRGPGVRSPLAWRQGGEEERPSNGGTTMNVTLKVGDRTMGRITEQVIIPEQNRAIKRNRNGAKTDLQQSLEIK